MPWVKTPIYYVSQAELGEFVCTHDYWLSADEVYKLIIEQESALMA